MALPGSDGALGAAQGHLSCTPAMGHAQNHLPGHLPGEQHPGVGQEQGVDAPGKDRTQDSSRFVAQAVVPALSSHRAALSRMLGSSRLLLGEGSVARTAALAAEHQAAVRAGLGESP